MRKLITRETTIEDLMRNPAAYGVPTLEQFKANRDRFLGRADEAMTCLSEGPTMFRKDLVKIQYKVRGVDIGGEDKVETMLSDFGYSLSEIGQALDCALSNRAPSEAPRLKLKMDMVPQGGGKFNVVIDFQP